MPKGSLLRGRLHTFAAVESTLATVAESGVRPAALLFTGDLPAAPGARGAGGRPARPAQVDEMLRR